MQSLLATRDLQRVAPSHEAAAAMLRSAANHVESAILVADSDPDGAYALLYDAARKSVGAVLQVQGLRATSRGGHYALQKTVAAQFTKPPPRDAFRPFGRLRRTRNQIEYDDISPVTPDDVHADEEVVRILHATAEQLAGVLPVFVD